MVDLSYMFKDMTTEWDQDYDTVRKGLHKFGKMNAKAYMTLLD